MRLYQQEAPRLAAAWLRNMEMTEQQMLERGGAADLDEVKYMRNQQGQLIQAAGFNQQACEAALFLMIGLMPAIDIENKNTDLFMGLLAATVDVLAMKVLKDKVVVHDPGQMELIQQIGGEDERAGGREEDDQGGGQGGLGEGARDAAPAVEEERADDPNPEGDQVDEPGRDPAVDPEGS